MSTIFSAVDQLSPLNNPEFPHDITFKVGPLGTTIHAHRAILCTKSDYFRSMLETSAFKESNESSIVLNATEPLAFMRMLEYLYSNSLRERFTELTFDELCDLFELADEYMLVDLQEDCVVNLYHKRFQNYDLTSIGKRFFGDMEFRDPRLGYASYSPPSLTQRFDDMIMRSDHSHNGFRVENVTNLDDSYANERSKAVRDHYGTEFEFLTTNNHGSSLMAEILPSPVASYGTLLLIPFTVSIDLSRQYDGKVGLTHRSYLSTVGPDLLGQSISEFEYFFLKRLRDNVRDGVSDARCIIPDYSIFRKSEFKFVKGLQRVGIMNLLPKRKGDGQKIDRFFNDYAEKELGYYKRYAFSCDRDDAISDRYVFNSDRHQGMGLAMGDGYVFNSYQEDAMSDRQSETIITTKNEKSHHSPPKPTPLWPDLRLIMPKVSYIERLILGKFCQKIQRIVRGFNVRRNKEAHIEKAKSTRIKDEKRLEQMKIYIRFMRSRHSAGKIQRQSKSDEVTRRYQGSMSDVNDP